ncbi:hypothetical protein KXD93_26120 [Mucilaginibacter sp. BJC16-A38]|uniref:hypothetical protein n=1 Tax=Mucilaginibacter phenanthrenivorans TaxID=1234842 RepID=UPI0021577B73|nr:hypothetical protein [Mucilaginibacter phenanthrenivorans]MCR8561162.1 hypothetical protein [Mucilaginibacter phenanthrenivorans]
MKYLKILAVVAFLTFSLQFAHANPLALKVEPTFLQLPPPPPHPPLPWSHRRHRRHHRASIHIRLPKPPPHPPGPPPPPHP